MYTPRHFHWAGPVVVILIGFGIHEWAKEHYHVRIVWDVVFIQLFLNSVSFYWSRFLWEAGVVYQKYKASMAIDAPGQVKPKPISEVIPEFKARVDLNSLIPVYQQVVSLPKFNQEQRFAIDILRMYDFDPHTQKHVDMTEELWVKTKKHFKQAELKNMKDKWVHFGLAKRENENRNSRYIVASRKKVAIVAGGDPLPEWPPSPPV